MNEEWVLPWMVANLNRANTPEELAQLARQELGIDQELIGLAQRALSSWDALKLPVRRVRPTCPKCGGDLELLVEREVAATTPQFEVRSDGAIELVESPEDEGLVEERFHALRCLDCTWTLIGEGNVAQLIRGAGQ